MMERIPSLSSLQEASPLLATFAPTTKTQESGIKDSKHTPLIASLSKAILQQQRQSSLASKDEFWDSLKSHYNFLMDGGLIDSCNEVKGDLEMENKDLTSSYTWTFKEYMEQYKQLLDWLDKVFNEVTSNQENNCLDEVVKKTLIEDMEKHAVIKKLIDEQGQRLLKKYPDSEKEIQWYTGQLGSHWERLENAIIDKRLHRDSKEIIKDVAFEIRCLRKWLREMENKLRPLTVYSGWTLEDLELKYKEHQSLQKDIESHGKNVLAVLKVCNDVQAGKDGTSSGYDVQHVLRIVKSLEHRWHAVCLLSLEWRYLLEDFISKAKQGLLPKPEVDLNVTDEPRPKFPRLSGEWTGPAFIPCKNIPFEELNAENHRSDHLENGIDEDLNLPSIEVNMSTEPVITPKTVLEDMRTRDIGTNYEPLNVSITNEKGIMVGSTGIMDLKADCEGDYKNFEIIQDIGYSSESSAHFSNDERSGETIQIYTYNDDKQHNIIKMKDEGGDVDNKPANDVLNQSETCNLVNNDLGKLSETGSLPASPKQVAENEDDEDGIVSRAGPNCATFYFRHVDTDPECRTEEFLSDHENRKRDMALERESLSKKPFVPLGLRRRQFSDISLSCRPSPERMNLEFSTDVESLEDSFSESEFVPSQYMTDNEKLQQLGLNTMNESNISNASNENEEMLTKAPDTESVSPNPNTNNNIVITINNNNRGSIQELVDQAERLVQEDKKKEMRDQPSWVEIKAKKSRLKEWLNTHQSVSCRGPTALPPETVIDSSCDASGEYTSSNDSEDEDSASSDEQNCSVILRRSNTLSAEGLLELPTPTNEEPKSVVPDEPVKVVMRNKKRSPADRPWSVTELYQLTNRVDLTPFSISESALNNLNSMNQDAKEFKDGCGAISRGEKSFRSTSLDNTSNSVRKSKMVKSRRKHARRSDSGSDGVPQSRMRLGGSDKGLYQRSPSHRRQSYQSKSHSSGSESGRKHRSLCGSGEGKSTSHSSGTEQYSSEAGGVGDAVKYENDSDSESELARSAVVTAKLPPSEELSSLSEQAWDDYQETHYLSEAYSEKIDEEQIKKLMEFGDDYRLFIESQSDTASQSSYSGICYWPGKRHDGNNKLQKTNSIEQLEPAGNDSDSDVEEHMQDILAQSSNQLQYSDNFLRKHIARESYGAAHHFNYGQLFATCDTNIKCLQVLENHIHSQSNLPSNVRDTIRAVISGWEKLKMQAHDQQQISHSLKKVQQEMSELRESMNNIDNSVTTCSKQIENKEILERMIQEVQAYLSAMQEKKTTLLTINLQVHSFLSCGNDVDITPLKEEVATLYHMWDQIFERSNHQLMELHGLKTKWTQYDAGVEELCAKLHRDQKLVTTTAARNLMSNEAKSNEVFVVGSRASPVSEMEMKLEELDKEQLLACQSQLKTLQRQAKTLETMLIDTDVWTTMSGKLSSIDDDLCRLQKAYQRMNPSPIKEDLPLPSKRIIVQDDDALPYNRSKTLMDNVERKERSLLRRVMRAALPFQLAIVVLICIACLLEPNCCDSLNNFTLSFSPQLRYVRGPPPI